MQNWLEENALREATGAGRTLPKEHKKKHHEELFTKSAFELEKSAEKPRDNDTTNRLFGLSREPNYVSETKAK